MTLRPHPKPRRRVGAAAVIEEHRAVEREDAPIEHPDGWYWRAADGHDEFGPFDSADAARADRDRGEDSGPDAALVEAESALGMNPWLDPETGAPAEGPAPPRLDSEDGPGRP